MIKGLMPALASLAFATVVTALPVIAIAATPTESKQIELQDGTKAVVEGENVYIINADGSKSPAPDGTHEVNDGSQIMTKHGKLVKDSTAN